MENSKEVLAYEKAQAELKALERCDVIVAIKQNYKRITGESLPSA